MKRGVQVGLCGATAKAHNWENADLLPGINVNTDAHGQVDSARSSRVRLAVLRYTDIFRRVTG